MSSYLNMFESVCICICERFESASVFECASAHECFFGLSASVFVNQRVCASQSAGVRGVFRVQDYMLRSSERLGGEGCQWSPFPPTSYFTDTTKKTKPKQRLVSFPPLPTFTF